MIYISYVYLSVKTNKKLFDIIISKSLFCIGICGILSEIFIRRIERAKIAFLITNHEKMIEKFAKPLIFCNSAKILLGLHIVIIFFAVLATFLKTKENRNIIALVTFLCFLFSFLIFFCCPYFIICYLFILLPKILGLFIVTLSIKELLPSHRKEKNIIAGKFKFVMCIIMLVFIIINIISNTTWIIFGGEIMKIFSIKPKY